jgi:hypothetical protein
MTHPTRKDAAEQQIEITPQMVEAALPYLDLYDGDNSDSVRFLTNVFRAMYVAQVVTPVRVKVVA